MCGPLCFTAVLLAIPPADPPGPAPGATAGATAEAPAAGGTPPGPGDPAAPAPPGDAASLVARLQRRYDETRSLRMDFTQRYHNRATGRTLEESGSLVVARPGRMRWTYRVPEPKLFVVSGETAWFHLPAEQVAYRMAAGGDAGRRLPSLFLAGEGRLERDFAATHEPADRGVRLRLDPLGTSEDYDHLVLQIDPGSLAVEQLSVVDVLGNVTEFRFRNEERDVPVAADAFAFTPPPGTEVVEGSPGR